MPFTFGPDVRLRSRTEFNAVQQQGRRLALRYVTVLSLPNARGVDRLGIIASRRLGGAVTRNRAKRRIREIFRRQERPATSAGQLSSFDFVIIPRRELVDAPFTAVEKEFQHALGRARGVKRS